MRQKGRATNLSDELSRLAGRFDRRGGLLQAKVAAAWKSVAGPNVAAHTTGAHIRGGEMVVFVDSPIWAAELSALSEKYRVAINEEIGQDAVKAIRFSVSRRVAEERELEQREAEDEAFYSEDKGASVPLSEQERAQVEMSASSIKDEELRKAVVRATIADLEWKKGLRAAEGRETPREGA